MKYIQVKFYITPDLQTAHDLIMAFAGECGFESFTDDENGLIGYCQDSLYDENSLKEVLDNIPLEDCKISFKASEAEYKDWNEEWEKAGFDPIIIDDKCIIECYNPEVEPADPQEKERPIRIYIDTKQAFGTGTHETTQMIVSTLFNLNLNNKRVLDCGCGTGILSITAAKLGAKEVIGYDIDEWSVENAKHNATINHVNIDILEGDRKVLSHTSGVFNLVMANINRNILLADLESFTEVLADNGYIILSGFYEKDVPILLQKATELNLKECQRLLNHDWCCLLLQQA